MRDNATFVLVCKASGLLLEISLRAKIAHGDLGEPCDMKRGLIVLILIVGTAMMVTSKTRLEKDAEALAHVIAERIFCDLTPTYSGFDAVSGKYDFDREGQQKFKQTYDHYFAAASIRFSNLTAEQQKLLCESADLAEDGDTRSIVD